MICPECGNELKEGAKFCVHCGAPVIETASDPVETTGDICQETETDAQVTSEAAAEEPLETAPDIEPAANTEQTKELKDEPTEEPKEKAVDEPKNETVEEQKNAAVEEQVTASESATPVPAAAEAVPYGTDPRMLLTTAQYFFLTILFHIPVVGLIFMFVWGLGRPRNLSLKRYSLAMLLLRLIGWILVLVCTVLMLLGLNGLIPGFVISGEFGPFIH